MRRVADHQVPTLGRGNAVEIVGMIHCDPLGQSVLRHCEPARFDVGKTQSVAKAVAEQSEADEAWARAPLEYARLTRHSEIMKQRQVFHARRPPSAIEMVAVIGPNIAVHGMPPQPPQSRLHDATLKCFQEVCEDVSPARATLSQLASLSLLPAPPNCAMRAGGKLHLPAGVLIQAN
jgi:hypothetical protein